MIRGNIAIPSAKSLKRPRPKRKPRTYPENMPVIVIPPPLRKRRPSAAQQQIPIIVEPKRKPNSMLAHLLEEITPKEHRRRGDLADNLFREIVRRCPQRVRDIMAEDPPRNGSTTRPRRRTAGCRANRPYSADEGGRGL